MPTPEKRKVGRPKWIEPENLRVRMTISCTPETKRLAQVFAGIDSTSIGILIDGLMSAEESRRASECE